MDENEWDLAMFNLEQYCHLILKYKLLVNRGSYPRTHSLRALIRILGENNPELLAMVEDNAKLHYVARLEEAYIVSRYMPYKFEERRLGMFTVLWWRCLSRLWRRYEEKLLEHMRRFREVGAEVKHILREIDPDVREFVFGSVVRGRFTAASDIDILVVTDDLSKKYEMMVEVYRRVEAPVELHITTPEKYRSWYSRFIPVDELVEI